MWTVIGGGLTALVGLATLVGLALDRQARGTAWARIASSRRSNTEDRRELEEFSFELGVREADLELRVQRIEFREELLLRREAAMDGLEQQRRHQLDVPGLSA